MSSKNDRKKRSIAFIALGCPKNTVDSEKMLAFIGQSGYILSGDADNADVVVINTCGFIEPARQEALDVISQVIGRKKAGYVGKIVVAGCLVQRMGNELIYLFPEIDALVGLDQRDSISSIIDSCFDRKKSIITEKSFPASNIIHDDTDRFLITPPHWAYLRISEGCDRKCSFCTIPSIRGPFRSKPVEMVLKEARQLVDNGAEELSIIAQDSCNYGRDLGIRDGLSDLISRLERIERLKWIRLMYLYPAMVNSRLIEKIAESTKVVNYIDMPIQHINNQILRSMRRSDTREKTLKLIENLRKAMDDVVLRTTVITGYPGETDQQFNELADFIKEIRFDALGCFEFHPEPETPAGRMEGQVPDEIKQMRRDRIMTIQQKIAFEKNQLLKGRKLECIVDEIVGDGDSIGRYYGQAPHIDSVCLIRNCRAQQGDFIGVRVLGSEDYDLIVQQIKD